MRDYGRDNQIDDSGIEGLIGAIIGLMIPIAFIASILIFGLQNKNSNTYDYKSGDHSEIIREESRDDRYEKHLQDLEDEAEAERMAPDWY